jgi:hypothetical protein
VDILTEVPVKKQETKLSIEIDGTGSKTKVKVATDPDVSSTPNESEATAKKAVSVGKIVIFWSRIAESERSSMVERVCSACDRGS